MCDVGEGINTDAGNDQEALFSLAALRGKGSLAVQKVKFKYGCITYCCLLP